MTATLQARTLRLVLGINAAMFVMEFGAGWLGESAGLIADSLDMLADAFVYGLSLLAVYGTATGRIRTAALSGVFQLTLGAVALLEVGRRFLAGSAPQPAYMIVVATVALVANAICLRAIARHRDEGVHMRASYIFSQNDVLANVAVIVSGLLVAATAMPLWDLVAGAGIGVLVLSGGVRILRASRAAHHAASPGRMDG